ncbi:hypothetical protein HX882_02775 [Pseudomonas gingeri]|uniref:Uncharacterized protein n=1 Tax=Pseudomonas gingeri TaxID=117681 RepID=A0A7Y7X9T0_9PSED|nr:hypothetical protein [Pseudomonas gingeri]NWB94812.1 hypothetical protein [Pseudomonas gingeri]
MTDILLVIITILLGVICILGFGILFNVSQAKIGISSLIRIIGDLHDTNANQCKERFELTTTQLEQLVETSISTEQNISDIKKVTDVIYRYKLPNAAEREFLDQIDI